MLVKTYCWFGLGAYALLSAADLALTYALLKTNGAAFESNPAAAACLERYGWTGLAIYKAAGASVFIAAVILILGRRRLRTGAALVTFGCTALLFVTTYTRTLMKDDREHATVNGRSKYELQENVGSLDFNRTLLPRRLIDTDRLIVGQRD